MQRDRPKENRPRWLAYRITLSGLTEEKQLGKLRKGKWTDIKSSSKRNRPSHNHHQVPNVISKKLSKPIEFPRSPKTSLKEASVQLPNLNIPSSRDASSKNAASEKSMKQIKDGKMNTTRRSDDTSDDVSNSHCYNEADGKPVHLDVEKKLKAGTAISKLLKDLRDLINSADDFERNNNNS